MGKLKNPSNFLTQVAMNIGLALKEHHGTNGYQVILSKAIASVIQKFLQRSVFVNLMLDFGVI